MSTLKVQNVQHPSAASAAIALSSDGTATLNGLAYGALSGRNRIINGDMRIDQRNAGASVTPTNLAYTVDRWFAGLTQASKFTVQQNAGSVNPPAGFTNYLGVTSSSAYSVASGDTFYIGQSIEGFNSADLDWGTANAKSITLSFWVRSSLTGTFGGSITNRTARSYPFSYTISAANTWEQKTITISGDTSGTWPTNNTASVSVYFGLGSGSTYSGTAGAWTGSVLVQSTSSVSVVGTNGATFYITGVQLEAGSVATPFERRSYGQELALCQRYYQIPLGIPVRPNGFDSFYNIGTFTFPLQVPMRTSPTVTTSGNFVGTPNNNSGPYYSFSVVGASSGTSTVSLNAGYSNAKTLDTAGVAWSPPSMFASAEL